MRIFWKALGTTALLLALQAPATAAEIAAFQPLGFSPDGDVFVFEQYGVQDGSGFPFVDIFAIDTENDAFLAGTPIHVRIEDENASLSSARAQAMQQAESLLKENGIGERPSHLVAFNPIGQLDTDEHVIKYRPYPAVPPFGNPYALSLEEISGLPGPACESAQDEVKGFRLILKEKDGQATNEIVYEDSSVPKSRSCPSGYRLSGVMTYYPAEGGAPGAPLHVALITVLSFGFEGYHGRWIAIPVRP